MPTDVFNNPSNDYINPGLSPCANAADEFDFKFLPRQEAGIVSGSNVMQILDLSDIIVPVTSWTTEKKYIASGEVIYVPGLTKGLVQRTQKFALPWNYYTTDQEFFMMMDVSINFYSNFRYYNIDVDSSANYSINVDIADAMNINFSNPRNAPGTSINAAVLIDASYFTFVGGGDGYEFNVTNAVLTLIDSSIDGCPLGCSPFPVSIDASGNRVPQTFVLSEDLTQSVPSAKYPNGAMRGYILKTYFPTTAGESDKWFYMNNVKSPYTVYEGVTVDVSGGEPTLYYNQYNKRIDVGMNGAGSSTIMSAGEYLDYITTYNLWDKVGDFRSHFSSLDPVESNISNLVGGFYIFNPHEFAIMVEYMLIN